MPINRWACLVRSNARSCCNNACGNELWETHTCVENHSIPDTHSLRCTCDICGKLPYHCELDRRRSHSGVCLRSFLSWMQPQSFDEKEYRNDELESEDDRHDSRKDSHLLKSRHVMPETLLLFFLFFLLIFLLVQLLFLFELLDCLVDLEEGLDV